MKFIEIVGSGSEKFCINAHQIVSFSSHDGGTYIKFRDGKTMFTTITYEAFKELVK